MDAGREVAPLTAATGTAKSLAKSAHRSPNDRHSHRFLDGTSANTFRQHLSVWGMRDTDRIRFEGFGELIAGENDRARRSARIRAHIPRVVCGSKAATSASLGTHARKTKVGLRRRVLEGAR